MPRSTATFPCGTIFICVVDPGVGTTRDALCIELGSYVFFGPNNGLFNAIVKSNSLSKIYRINQECIKPASSTFHGRDLFVPAAIAYAQGRRDFLQKISPKALDCTAYVLSDYIAYIDSFGNIKTTISSDDKALYHTKLTLLIRNREYHIPFVKTFSDVKSGELLCYKGSNDTLEIAVNRGSAQHYLQVDVGDQVQLL